MVVHNIDLFLGNLFCAGALRIGFRDALASLLLSVVNVHLLPKQPLQWISMLLRVVHSLACAGYMHEMPVDRRGETRDETRDGATKLVQFRFYRAAFVFYFIPLLGGGLAVVAQWPLFFCQSLSHSIGSDSPLLPDNDRKHFSGLLNTSWRLIYSPDGLSTQIHFSSAPPLYLTIDKVALFY